MSIPFFVTNPMSIIMPIWEKMFNVRFRYQREMTAPQSARGTVTMIIIGSIKLSNCAARIR
jgi:hypothetical protein